jgi:hypothetical protein
MDAPSIHAQIEALAVAYVELGKFLGRQQVIPVGQLSTVLKTAAKSAADQETKTALSELARRLVA